MLPEEQILADPPWGPALRRSHYDLAQVSSIDELARDINPAYLTPTSLSNTMHS